MKRFSILAAALAIVPGAAFSQSQSLGRTITVQASIRSATEPVPYFAGSHLIQHRGYSESQAEAKIRLLDPATNHWRELNPWPAEATEGLTIKGVAPLSDGRVVVGLRAISVENQRAEILAVYDKNGNMSWFRTNPFAWDSFAVDPANSVWMIGGCPDYLASECGGTDYATLRHYSLDGEELGAYLPVGLIKGDPLWGARPTGRSRVFASGSRIGVLVAGTHEWLQVDREGRLLSRETLAFPASVYSGFVGMTDDGRFVLQPNGVPHLMEWTRESRSFEQVPGLGGGFFTGIQNGRAVFIDVKFGEPLQIRFLDYPAASKRAVAASAVQ